MLYTDNLSLSKPESADPPDISVLSTNMDTIDASANCFMARQAIIDGNFQIAQLGYPTASVIFTDTGDLVTLNNHGMVNGETCTFPVITTTTGITVDTTYYVISATPNTFQVSLTSGGSAVALTTNGTGTVQYSYSLNPTYASYPVFDMWRNLYVNATPPAKIKHSQRLLLNGEVPNSSYCYKINVDGAGSLSANDYNAIQCFIEKGTRYMCGINKKITVKFKARSTIANKKIGVYSGQYYGTGGSPSAAELIVGDNFALTSSWEDFKITINTNTLNGKIFGSNNDDYLRLNFVYAWGDGSVAPYVNSSGVAETFRGAGDIEIAQVQLCAGDVALPFMPKTYEEELRSCQRYYKVVASGNTAVNSMSAIGFAYGTTSAIGVIPLSVPMRTLPTTVIVGTIASINLGVISSGVWACSAITTRASFSSNSFIALDITTASGMTSGASYALQLNSVLSKLILDSRF